MLLADVVVRAVDAPLEDRKVALNRVRMHVSTDILARAVIDGTMLAEFATDLLGRSAFVGHDVGSTVDLSFNDRAKVRRSDSGDMVRANLAAAFNEREHSFLTN